MLITFEGINGCGKTSQVNKIQKHLTQKGLESITAKEPSTLGTSIRTLLIERTSIDPMTKLLIFQADRNENMLQNIIPALESGKIVLCDRFTDSTIAYQIYGNGLDPKLVLGLNKISSHKRIPDLTFWLDTSISECARRNDLRPDKSTRHNYKTKYLNKVRDGYLQIADKNRDRVIRIDGNRNISVITSEIISIVTNKIDAAAIPN
jgi:dTMP kinase